MALDGLGERVYVAGRNQRGVDVVFQAVDYAYRAGGDDRQAAGHRFQDGVGKAFSVGRGNK